MQQTDPSRIVETLARRGEFLTALREGPRSKRTLETTLPISRSTVDRAVRDLESVGLVTRKGGMVELTLPGRLILEQYEDLKKGIEGLTEASAVLEPVPPGTDLELAVFKGVEVVVSSRHAPQQPVEALKEFLADATRIRVVASAVLPDYVDLYRRQIIEEGTTVDLVVAGEVLETLVTEYRDPLERALATGRLRLFESGERPPFSTIIAHHGAPELAIVVYGEAGTAGFLRNDNAEALDWARGWVDGWIDRADPISGSTDLGR